MGKVQKTDGVISLSKHWQFTEIITYIVDV